MQLGLFRLRLLFDRRQRLVDKLTHFLGVPGKSTGYPAPFPQIRT
jgi:hypothetical protein